jgi:chromosome partitioning protein
MRIIAFMNQKGGVAKTTTTVNLGAALAEMGARVLLMDLDPQSHLTINYGVELPDEHANLYDVVCGDAAFADCLHSLDRNVSVAPGAIDLAGAEMELAGRPDRTTVLRNKMAAAGLQFDYILIDCPPSLGLLTLNALAVAGEVIIPMQPHFLAMQGMAKLLETVQLVNQQINPRLKIGGIVLTMFDAQTKLSSEVVSELEGFFEGARGQALPWSEARVCKTKIRRNIKLAESPSFGQPVLKYDSASNGASDYRALAREVATMRAWPSGLDRAGAPLPTPKSLVERAMESADRPSERPEVQATVNPALDATRTAAARVAGTSTPSPSGRGPG